MPKAVGVWILSKHSKLGLVLIFFVLSSVRFSSIQILRFDGCNFSSVIAEAFSIKLLKHSISLIHK